MGIKWDDVRILNSPITNQIYLGKGKADKKYPGVWIATDKSKDRTDEMLSATMGYMDRWANDNKCKGMEISNVMGTLTWRKKDEQIK